MLQSKKLLNNTFIVKGVHLVMFNFFKKKTETPMKEVRSEQRTQEEKEVKPVKKTQKTYFEKTVDAANKGNVLAAAHVGVSYHYGIEVGAEEHPQGLEPNPELALEYLNMAAQKGYLKSQIDLGLIYLDADSPVFDIDKALEWITLTAKKGDAFSQYVIGHYYNTGDYLPRDELKAYHWLLESAYNGCEGGMLEIARIYNQKASELLEKEELTDEEKRESYENSQLAFKWYKEAADLGEEEAMFYTGVYYTAGCGVEENREKGLHYIDLAIENGFEAAIDFKNQYFAQEDL